MLMTQMPNIVEEGLISLLSFGLKEQKDLGHLIETPSAFPPKQSLGICHIS
jgi:hypothetical protein